MTDIPVDFARTILELHGEAGAAWLARLPDTLAGYAHRWGLEIGPPFAPLSYHYVAPARRADGAEVVLKVGVPHRELLAEIAALQLYDGHGIALLLDADPAGGALLLERLLPGTPLADLADDAAATAIAAEVMRALWRPAPADHPFPTIADWGRGFARMRAHFGGGTGPLPSRLVAQAEELFGDLLASQAPGVLLHGDLHHWNIRAAHRRPWLALDPKGVVGEPAYEIGALLRNRLPTPWDGAAARRRTTRRLDQLAAALTLDRARLRAWGLAQAVLSAWWSLEDHGHGWEPAIALAALLDE